MLTRMEAVGEKTKELWKLSELQAVCGVCACMCACIWACVCVYVCACTCVDQCQYVWH